MGLKDRRGDIDPQFVRAAEIIADMLYPDMHTIPGGESARPQRAHDKSATKDQGAQVLRFLHVQGLIDIAAVNATLGE